MATSCGRWTSTCWGRRSKLVSPCVAAHLWRRRSRFTPSPPSPPRLAARRCRVAARLRPSLTVCLVPADSPTVPLGNCRLNSPSDRAAILPSARVQWCTCAHTRSILTPHRRALSGERGDPATAATAFPCGQRPAQIAGQDVSALWGAFPYSVPFNITGQPAASLPCGFSAEGLPIGLQVAGRVGEDALVLRACAAFEQVRPWGQLRPAL